MSFCGLAAIAQANDTGSSLFIKAHAFQEGRKKQESELWYNPSTTPLLSLSCRSELHERYITSCVTSTDFTLPVLSKDTQPTRSSIALGTSWGFQAPFIHPGPCIISPLVPGRYDTPKDPEPGIREHVDLMLDNSPIRSAKSPLQESRKTELSTRTNCFCLSGHPAPAVHVANANATVLDINDDIERPYCAMGRNVILLDLFLSDTSMQWFYS
ncbi:hypothetical protein An13g02830 [Aspergillus niger]|uniref:Uncharacterized protein n=2 Tax=Aspergillus niger TaxID=5061 RepID=A2R1X9_ASPNC|nr:hypothetical protein An13g02830 [Aspergillus niger]CAK41679.1 hypothetical protein An13g02830 [Aspergillus niger]